MSRKIALAHARAFFRDSFIPKTPCGARKTATFKRESKITLIAKLGKSSDSEGLNRHFLGKNRVKLGHFLSPKFIYPAPKIKKEGI